jgi:(2Fe-2S) ferredoxin
MSEIKERHILICKGKHCLNKGSENICNMLEKTLEEKNLNVIVSVEYGNCHHLHMFGPIMIIKPDDILYVEVNPNDIEEIITQHIINNNVVDRLLLRNPNTGEIIQDYEDAQKFVKSYKKELKSNDL